MRRRSSSVCDSFGIIAKQRLTVTDDAASAARRVRGDFPGQDKEAKKAGEEGFEAVRATAQDYVRHSLTLELSSSCTDPQQTNRASAEAKKAEADLRAYSQQAQNKAQEYTREAQNKAQEYSAEAQAKYNKLSVDAKKKWDEARARGEEFTRETSKDFNAAVDRFDKEVTKDAAQAKSWLGSWFGGK